MRIFKSKSSNSLAKDAVKKLEKEEKETPKTDEKNQEQLELKVYKYIRIKEIEMKFKLIYLKGRRRFTSH